MTTFFIECRIGGASIVKVEAPTEKIAVEAAQHATVEDWNEAGQLRPGDVRTKVRKLRPRNFDASIVAKEIGTYGPVWAYAADDPSQEVPD